MAIINNIVKVNDAIGDYVITATKSGYNNWTTILKTSDIKTHYSSTALVIALQNQQNRHLSKQSNYSLKAKFN